MNDQIPENFRLKLLAPILIGGMAVFLMLWGLGEKYLWQDEAATAVLSDRLLKFGKPLAYDGINLITLDYFVGEDVNAMDQCTANPRVAVDFFIKRGHYKADTTWKWQPWGQFVITAASLKLLGYTTIAARLPFALAGIAAVLLLHRLVRRSYGSTWMATLATLMLVFNGYWILHNRQCRYYSLSSLFLVLTLLAYIRWQQGGKWGGGLFVLAGWCWFQMDYGTIWPVMGVLFIDAFLMRRNFWQPLLVGLLLAVSIAPFVYYYELWGRVAIASGTWGERFSNNLFNLNQYVVPVVVIIAAAGLLIRLWKELPLIERRLTLIGCNILIILLFWVPTVAPTAFLRYVVMVTPVACMVAAWVIVQGVKLVAFPTPWVPALAAALVLTFTPILTLPPLLLIKPPMWARIGTVIRPELKSLAISLFGHQPDSNRLVIDWLKQNAEPTDEILINYEDVPLMFYLPNPIRGGIAAFRVEDDAKTLPRFAVLRRGVPFTYWPAFNREGLRHNWELIPVQAPDVLWANNPDPMGQGQNPATSPALWFARRVEKNTP